jgi:SPFH domain / Band 7 family
MGGTVIAVVLIVVLVAALAAIVLAAASVRVLREYERGVVFRLGRVIDERGPGLVLLIPAVDRMVRVTLRTVTLRIPPQDVITRDNVPVRVAAVAYFRVIDPRCSVLEVEDFMAATLQIAQTTLRSVLGKAELDALLSERERLNENLQQIIDEQTEPWGIKVTIVEIKDVEIPEGMQHALARQAEAERNRRAKVINAEGEYQAADRLAEAANVISPNPVTLQLRYLQALSDISSNQASTIVFPLPMDLLRPLLGANAGSGHEGAEAGGGREGGEGRESGGSLESGEAGEVGAAPPRHWRTASRRSRRPCRAPTRRRSSRGRRGRSARDRSRSRSHSHSCACVTSRAWLCQPRERRASKGGASGGPRHLNRVIRGQRTPDPPRGVVIRGPWKVLGPYDREVSKDPREAEPTPPSPLPDPVGQAETVARTHRAPGGAGARERSAPARC